jgi:hypothetical protein
VKGHSGIEDNEIADELAKEAAIKTAVIIPRVVQNRKHIRYLAHHEDPIERSFRKFVTLF